MRELSQKFRLSNLISSRSKGDLKADLTRCDLRRDPAARFVAFDGWQRQLQVVVHPVGFGSSSHYSL
jgi:hypothetical protein